MQGSGAGRVDGGLELEAELACTGISQTTRGGGTSVTLGWLPLWVICISVGQCSHEGLTPE